MTTFLVGNQGNMSYSQAEDYARKQGYGTDAIHAQGDEPNVDIINRQTNEFIAKNVSAAEGARIQREAGDVATRAPAGQYTNPNFSYTPDRNVARPASQSSNNVIVAQGGPTHDATSEQIAQAKASGQAYYLGGVRYSSNQNPTYSKDYVGTSSTHIINDRGQIVGTRPASSFSGLNPNLVGPVSQQQGRSSLVDLGQVPQRSPSLPSNGYTNYQRPNPFQPQPSQPLPAMPANKSPSPGSNLLFSGFNPYLVGPVSQSPVPQQTPTGFLRKATPEEIKGMQREQNPIFNIFENIKTGAKAAFGNQESGLQLGQSLRSNDKTAILGLGSFLALSVVGEGESKLVGAAEKVAQGSKVVVKGYQAVKAFNIGKIPAGYLGILGARALVLSPVLSYGFGKVQQITAPQEQKEIIKNKDYSEGFKIFVQSEEETVNKNNFNIFGLSFPTTTEGFARIISSSDLVASQRTREISKAKVQEFALSKGLDPELFYKQVSEQNRAEGIGGIIAMGNIISAGSEWMGGLNVAKKFAQKEVIQQSKAGAALFFKTFNRIGIPALFEGEGQYLLQSFQVREKPTVKGALLIGGLSYGIGGGLGSGIISTSVNNPKISNRLLTGAYLTDPFEYYGDVMQRLEQRSISLATKTPFEESVIRKVGPDALQLGTEQRSIKSFGDIFTKDLFNSFSKGVPKNTPIFTPTSAFSFSSSSRGPTPTPTPTSTSTKTAAQSPTSAYSPANTPFLTSTPTNIPSPLNIFTNTPVTVPTPAPVNFFTNIFTPTPTPTPTTTPTPTPTPTPIITDVPIPVPITTNENTPVNTNTNTNIFIDIFSSTPVPVTVPLMRLPPPFLPNFGFGGDYGYRKGQRKIYVNELQIGQAILNNMLTGQAINLNNSIRRTGRGGKNQMNTFGFQNPFFRIIPLKVQKGKSRR